MKRAAVLRLNEKVWIEDIVEGDALAVAIIPSAGVLTGALLFDPLSESRCGKICEKLFVDFRGYEGDDGAPVPNSKEARLELYNYAPVRQRIGEVLNEITEQAAKGEAVAASD